MLDGTRSGVLRKDGTTYQRTPLGRGDGRGPSDHEPSPRAADRARPLGRIDDDHLDAHPAGRTAPPAEAATAAPTVAGRGTWGADPAYMTWAPQFYATRKLVVHHTDTSDDYTDRAGAEAQVRAIYYYHSVTQGWGDIGYNFLIDKFGNIYEGRYSREYAGANRPATTRRARGDRCAHGGWNSGTVGWPCSAR